MVDVAEKLLKELAKSSAIPADKLKKMIESARDEPAWQLADGGEEAAECVILADNIMRSLGVLEDGLKPILCPARATPAPEKSTVVRVDRSDLVQRLQDISVKVEMIIAIVDL